MRKLLMWILLIAPHCLAPMKAPASFPTGADAIRTSRPEDDKKLESHNYHTFRSKLLNAQLIFTREKRGRIAFLGGSITANGGWRDSICHYFQAKFPETDFDFIAAGIPSMGSTPHAFRLTRDVLGKGKVDLLFVEAAVNDRGNGRSNTEQVRAMEGIVRHSRESNPYMDIVMMHFVDPEKMREYRTNIVPPEIENHEKVAGHYGVSTINLAREVTDRIDNGEFTWEKDFRDLHPSPFGQQVYYHSMRSFLDTCLMGFKSDNQSVAAYPMPARLDNASYDKGILILPVEAKSAKGWFLNEHWEPSDKASTRADFTGVPMLIAEEKGKALNFDFEGNAVGIAVAAGPDAGSIKYRIDKGEWEKLDLYTKWSGKLHLPWFYTLGAGLKPGKHRVQIKLLKEKNNPDKGNACRIRYFYVNRD
jgi:sialidase-1